jgi:hypothetical protein
VQVNPATPDETGYAYYLYSLWTFLASIVLSKPYNPEHLRASALATPDDHLYSLSTFLSSVVLSRPYNPEHVPASALATPDDHLICADCLRAHTLAQCEQSAERIECTARACTGEFDMSASAPRARALVAPNILRMLQRRATFAELNRAGAADALVHCPFCDFAMILDGDGGDDRVFYCLNVDCMRESCR